MGELPNGMRLLTTGEQRFESIINDSPGLIRFDQSTVYPDHSEYSHAWYVIEPLGVKAVYQNSLSIATYAAEYKLDPNLLTAIVYLENSHGYYDVIKPIPESVGPANIGYVWSGLLGGTDSDLTNDPNYNVQTAAKLLAELRERFPGATPEALASLYNNLRADMLTGYGLTVKAYMSERPWLPFLDLLQQLSSELKDIPNGFIVDAMRQAGAQRCFPAHTRIQTSRSTSTAISALRVGDVVLAFDARADKGRGALVPRRVTRLYRNTTTDWIRLRWVHGTAREVITTPGHHFLDALGAFPTIEDMTRTGRATVVLASGALTEVTAERIVYSAETAHLFERAHVQRMVAGNAALRPVEADAWATYNIEVEDLHTYVAEGLRVHNDSGWLGTLATAILSPGNTGVGLEVDINGNVLTIGEDRRNHDGFVDTILDGASNFLHGVGTVANAIIDGIGDAARAVFGPGGNSNTYGNLTRTSWNDTDGHTHWGSLNELDRAQDAGTVASVIDGGDDSGSGGSGPVVLEKKEASGTDGGSKDLDKDGIDTGSFTVTVKYKPILLDLNGNGIEIATLDRSTTLVDSNGDGLQHRTAWAGSGDGVLFFDAGMDGLITEQREYVFTEWDPTAKDDMAALRSRFDSNNDGKLTAADAEFGKFKVMVTNADGSQSAKTLAQLGITEINLKTDATEITFADGSQITGQTTFTMGGVVKTAAAVTLVAEADGHKLETMVDGATTTYVAKDGAGGVMGRGRRGRRRGAGSVHMWTVWKLTESQGSVNFCSSDVKGIVSVAIRVGRWAMPINGGNGNNVTAKGQRKCWTLPAMRLLVLRNFASRAREERQKSFGTKG